MYTLQGIISRSVDNANVQFENLGYITTNVSNYNTVGYKTQRFDNYLQENGRIEGVIRTDYSEGAYMATGKPLDFAVKGAGFFAVTNKEGKTVYTRDGSFKINTDGYLVTQDGCLVGDGIKIPINYRKLKVSPDGKVSVIMDKNVEPEVIGEIPVVIFSNPEGLQSIEGNKLAETAESGKPKLLKSDQSVAQGNLERSNVDIMQSVEEVLRMNGSMIASTRLIKVVDEFYRQSVNLRQ